MKYLTLTALCCLLASVAFAQTQLAQKKTLQATRITEKITLDGRIDEPAWFSAPFATYFLFLWPTPGTTDPLKP